MPHRQHLLLYSYSGRPAPLRLTFAYAIRRPQPAYGVPPSCLPLESVLASGVIKYHGPRPVPAPGRVWVANHSSMIDFAVLGAYSPFAGETLLLELAVGGVTCAGCWSALSSKRGPGCCSAQHLVPAVSGRIWLVHHTPAPPFPFPPLLNPAAIMQLHPGWVGMLQRRYLSALGCLWFNRTEVRAGCSWVQSRALVCCCVRHPLRSSADTGLHTLPASHGAGLPKWSHLIRSH